MTSATDNRTTELRELLDEFARAYDFIGGEDEEHQKYLNLVAEYSERIEQAVAATLGRGTCEKVYAVGGIIAQAKCKDVCASVSEFTCSACGFNCDLTSWISLFDGDDGRHRHHHHGTPNYCPNCGREVVDA